MTTDATQVTGSPLPAEGLARRGDVLAERYELLETLDTEGPSAGYRALDQETERSVLVRLLAGPGLDEPTLREVLGRLRGLIGVGGRHLSSLLDADREGRRPFTVEAWPAGTPLSAIFASRRVREGSLGAREVLPVLARVAAALAAVPEPWYHGDVRAERVWVDTDGVRLTGAFLLAALPPPLLQERIQALGPGAIAYAPEVAKGRAGSAADRWGLAAMTWEALTGRAPDLTSKPAEISPPLLVALRRLIDPQPGRRPKDVTALIEALARQAELSVPEIDPEAHRPPAAEIGRPPRAAAPPRPARRIEGAADEGTQEVSFDQILEERTIAAPRGPDEGTEELDLDSDDALDPDLVQAALADDTARHAPVSLDAPESGESGLDPRLVRAALGMTLEDGPEGDHGLDPRLVRAALGVEEGEPSSNEELPSDELEVLGQPTPRPAPAPTPKPAPASAAPSHATPRPEAARPRPSRPAVGDAPVSEPARAASGQDGGTAIVQRPEEPPRVTPRRRAPLAGPMIVVGALLVAVVIVALGFVVRSWMSRQEDSAERSRHIQERLEQIRSAEP